MRNGKREREREERERERERGEKKGRKDIGKNERNYERAEELQLR